MRRMMTALACFALVESVQERVELVEQRQSFIESLLESRTQRVRLEEGVDRSAGRALK